MREIQKYFDEFVEAITLGAKQVARIESASVSLTSFLRGRYRLARRRVFLQGSYANKTAVKPVDGGEYDVDIVCECADGSDSPEDALEDLRATIDDHGTYQDMTEMKAPCVRIRYADEKIGGFHVDVVPVRPADGGVAPLEAPRQNQGWHATAPREYTAWCANQGSDFIRVVKMLKRWRDEHQDVRGAVKSIVLQVLIAKHLPHISAEDPILIHRTLLGISGELEPLDEPPVILNPVLDSENLAKRWETNSFNDFKNELRAAVETARQAVEATTIVEACERWREVFGAAFPMVPNSGKLKVSLDDRSHQQAPNDRGWVVSSNPRYRINIRAEERIGKFGRWNSYPSNGPLLFKGKWLRFTADVMAPTDVEIWWRVTNTGQHAKAEECLRGEFFKARTQKNRPSPNPAENWEITSYRGAHLVDAVLVVGKTVVARSDPITVNIHGIANSWPR